MSLHITLIFAIIFPLKWVYAEIACLHEMFVLSYSMNVVSALLIVSGNGLLPNRRQSITRINDDPIHLHIYAYMRHPAFSQLKLTEDSLTHWTLMVREYEIFPNDSSVTSNNILFKLGVIEYATPSP